MNLFNTLNIMNDNEAFAALTTGAYVKFKSDSSGHIGRAFLITSTDLLSGYCELRYDGSKSTVGPPKSIDISANIKEIELL